MSTHYYDPDKNGTSSDQNNDQDDGSDDLPPVDKKVRPSEQPDSSEHYEPHEMPETPGLADGELLELAMLHGGPG